MNAPTFPSEADRMVAQAHAAQSIWAARPIRERVSLVRNFRHLLVERAKDLCDAVTRDLGKTPEETLGGELLGLADACRFLEVEADRLLRPRKISRHRPLALWGQRDTVYRRPRGVVGIIGTWNYPLYLNGIQIAQALTAGNAVVWKPSEVAPASATILHDLWMRAGLTPELLGLLPATREGGPAFLETKLDHVVFTGAVPTGRAIAARLGQRLISSTLELSGCDAQFVLPGVDSAFVPFAARAAWFAATVNRGQTCIAVRRAFVPRSLYPAYCEALRTCAQGAPRLALALPAQGRQLEELVRDALSNGGRLLLETPAQEITRTGESGKPECQPVVIADAHPDMAFCREAAFAPIMGVVPYDTLEEALAMEARCPLALGASIFTMDRAAGEALASRLRAGVVTINDVIAPVAHPATPFGGRGESGWGTTQGAEGLVEMTIPQVVSSRGGQFRPHFDLAASSDTSKAAKTGPLIRGLLEAGHGRTFWQRLGGWWKVLRAARNQ